MDKIADRLYALEPDQFVAARDKHQAEAKNDKELARAIKGLARPTRSAWLINQMVRHRRRDLEQLLDLGAELRKAQETLAGEELKQLSAQRRALLQQLAREGRALAKELGHPVSQTVEQEVSATLGAALADPKLAEKVRSGRLTKALSYSGFGDLESAVLYVPPRRPQAVAKKPRIDREKLARELEQSEQALTAAQAERDRAEQRIERLKTELGEAQSALEEAESALQAARKQRKNAEKRHRG